MNKAKKLKDIKSITELDPSKVYLIGVGGKLDELFETAKKIYDAMLQFGVEKVLIIPENFIKSVIEISEEETEKVVKEIEKRQDRLVNREKQIKEIAEIINAKYKEWLDATDIIPEGTAYYAECLERSAYYCAVALYEAGYRNERPVSIDEPGPRGEEGLIW